MKFWYFRFEGQFLDGSPKYGSKNVFSSCLVPVSIYRRAKSIFLRTLKTERIKLLGILEQFTVDANELDPEDEQNTFWIEWYEEARKAGKPVLDKYHVFDE